MWFCGSRKPTRARNEGFAIQLRPAATLSIPAAATGKGTNIGGCRHGNARASGGLLATTVQSSHALPALVKASIASIRLGKTRNKGSNLVISNSCHTRGFTPLKAILLPDFWQLT